MENIIFSANVVMPLMIVMLVGFFSRRINIIDDRTSSQCNSLAFKVFLPILLFNNARNATMESVTSWEIFVFVAVMITIIFAIVIFIIVKIEKDNAKRGVMIQGICRSNYALFGIKLVELLFPNENLSIASMLIVVVIPIFNIYSVAVLTYFGAKKANFKNILIGIVKNPLIIATLSGVAVMFAGIEFPFIIDKSLLNLGDIASTFALFMLGAGFDFKQITRVKKQLALVCVSRLVIVPAIVLSIAVLLGFRSIELACLMVVFASPTAASSYTMAEKMGGDKDLASSVVVFTSILSIVSIFGIILMLKQFAFL